MRKVLFICLQGLHRSRTAADMFSSWPNCETKSAGQLDNAPFPLSQEDLEWATIIFTMEKPQKKKLLKKFKEILDGKRIICLDIPDIFDFGDEQLKRILDGKVGRHLTIK